MKSDVGDIMLGDRRISVTVTRSRRRRRTIAFQMENPSSLKITAPVRASLSSIRAIIQKQSGWIKRRLAEFQKLAVGQPVRRANSFYDGASIIYLGHAYALSVTHDLGQPQGCRLLPRRLIVNLHADRLTGKDLQDELRLEIMLWLKKRAKAKFQRRMDWWAQHLGVSYRKLMVANAERRWGSCNVQNVIRLNWRLILAPLPILDYVVVHELCHVLNKNHGPRFWGQVASVMPDYKLRRKNLHMISAGLAF